MDEAVSSFDFSDKQNKAWALVNKLIDEGRGGTPEYQAVWDEWSRIVSRSETG